MAFTSATVSSETHGMPQLCDETFHSFGNDVKLRLAEIAYLESQEKKIAMRRYNSTLIGITVDYWDEYGNLKEAGGNYYVRFSPFFCDELGLDGGGFDVEIDPHTFGVVASGVSVY